MEALKEFRIERANLHTQVEYEDYCVTPLDEKVQTLQHVEMECHGMMTSIVRMPR